VKARHLSIRLRLLLAGTAGVALALLMTGAALLMLFERHVERVAFSDLQDRLAHVLSAVEPGPGGTLLMPDPPGDPLYDQPYSGHYWIVEGPGTTLRSRSLWDATLSADAGSGETWQGALVGPMGEPLLAVARRVDMATVAGDVELRVAVAVDRAALDAARTGFLSDLAPTLGFLGLALVAALAAAIALALRPLSTLGRRAAALNSGRARRLGDDVPAEVRPLAAELDALLTAREDEVERARLRAGDLAHGLKTPLQALMGEAARLRAAGEPDAAQGIEEVVRAMRAHVDRELARARLAADGGATCDPHEVASAVAAVLRRTPDGSRLAIEIEGAPATRARIDRADLAEALGALAENAVRHARSRVVIACGREGGRATIRVRDDGPGVEPAFLDRLTDRGVRLDEREGGTGLGLAIAADVAAAAGGALALRNLKLGFEAELVLPCLA
jgi:signal transduction histidine kinase